MKRYPFGGLFFPSYLQGIRTGKNPSRPVFGPRSTSQSRPHLFGLMVLGLFSSCKLQSVSESVEQSGLTAASTVSDELKNFCSSASSFLGATYYDEIKYLCDPTENERLQKVIDNAYDGGNGVDKGVKEIKLKSEGKTTSFAFIGALVVPKSLKEMDRVRKKSQEISLFDPMGITITYTVDKEKAPSKPKHQECYDISEKTKDPFGQNKVSLESCFYALGDKTLVSYQGVAADDKTDKANRTVFVRIQVADHKTLVLAATSKDVDNRGLASLVEGVVRGQAPQILVQFYDLVKKAPEAQTIPRAISLEDAADFNDANVTEDWSWGRTKLSCKPDTGIYGIKQTNYTTGKPKSIIQIECGISMKAESTNKYRYVEAGQKFLPTADLDCGDHEYVAGVSYHRYSDKTHIMDGIKSLLCMEKKSAKTTCTTRSDTCEDGEYLKGLKLERIGGFICDGKRQDDDGTGCYRAKSITCCK